jgi:hypothetical protein
MEELEPRTVLSSSVLSGTAGADAILIRRDPAYPAKIEVQIGTSSRISLGLVAGDTLTINAGGGNDTFYVWDTFAGVTLRVNGEGDNDTFNISPAARSLDTIDGPVIVDGGGGPDTLNVDDRNNALARTFTVTDASVGRDASATISYGSVGSLNLNGGGPQVTYNVERTPAGVTTTITGGAGNDDFRVSPTARQFGYIKGNLNVSGGSGLNRLTVYDNLTLGLSTYTVTSSGSPARLMTPAARAPAALPP